MAGRKRMFGRWKQLSERKQLVERCRRVIQVVGSLNAVVKSVADNAFANNQDSTAKERALLRMMAAFRGGVGDSFARWRDLTRIEQLRSAMTQDQKKYILRLLANMLQGGKQQRIREVIAKFRANSRIARVQKSFLKRLLQSKAGMVAMAFREIRSLPERRDSKYDKKANRFEKGLSEFINRTLRRSLEAFQREH